MYFILSPDSDAALVEAPAVLVTLCMALIVRCCCNIDCACLICSVSIATLLFAAKLWMTFNRHVSEGSSCINSWSILCGGIRDCMPPSSTTSSGLRRFDVTCCTSLKSIFANSFAMSRGGRWKCGRLSPATRFPVAALDSIWSLGCIFRKWILVRVQVLWLYFWRLFSLRPSGQCLHTYHVGAPNCMTSCYSAAGGIWAVLVSSCLITSGLMRWSSSLIKSSMSVFAQSLVESRISMLGAFATLSRSSAFFHRPWSDLKLGMMAHNPISVEAHDWSQCDLHHNHKNLFRGTKAIPSSCLCEALNLWT